MLAHVTYFVHFRHKPYCQHLIGRIGNYIWICTSHLSRRKYQLLLRILTQQKSLEIFFFIQEKIIYLPKVFSIKLKYMYLSYHMASLLFSGCCHVVYNVKTTRYITHSAGTSNAITTPVMFTEAMLTEKECTNCFLYVTVSIVLVLYL